MNSVFAGADSDVSDQASAWRRLSYDDEMVTSTMTLRELLRYFRQLHKMKSRCSEAADAESAISETDYSEISVFTSDLGDNDSGVSLSRAETPRKNRLLSLREVLYFLKISKS